MQYFGLSDIFIEILTSFKAKCSYISGVDFFLSDKTVTYFEIRSKIMIFLILFAQAFSPVASLFFPSKPFII